MKMNEILTRVNEGLKYYEVQYWDREGVVCEDGEIRVRPGYHVVNTVTKVHEHTTTLLPGAIFQAQHLDATLDGLLNPQETYALEEMPMDDVVAN